MKYVIREIKDEETGILEDMLYEAVFNPDKTRPWPRDVIRRKGSR